MEVGRNQINSGLSKLKAGLKPLLEMVSVCVCVCVCVCEKESWMCGIGLCGRALLEDLGGISPLAHLYLYHVATIMTRFCRLLLYKCLAVLTFT